LQIHQHHIGLCLKTKLDGIQPISGLAGNAKIRLLAHQTN
jgi:hypothetical protein